MQFSEIEPMEEENTELENIQNAVSQNMSEALDILYITFDADLPYIESK